MLQLSRHLSPRLRGVDRPRLPAHLAVSDQCWPSFIEAGRGRRGGSTLHGLITQEVQSCDVIHTKRFTLHNNPSLSYSGP